MSARRCSRCRGLLVGASTIGYYSSGLCAGKQDRRECEDCGYCAYDGTPEYDALGEPWQCACCGPADEPLSPLASLCDYCAAGECDACNGVTSGAPFAGSGYVEAPETPCTECCGGFTLHWHVTHFEEDVCDVCGGRGYTSDPAHGLTSMTPEWCHALTSLSLAWCHYLTQTTEESSHV